MTTNWHVLYDSRLKVTSTNWEKTTVDLKTKLENQNIAVDIDVSPVTGDISVGAQNLDELNRFVNFMYQGRLELQDPVLIGNEYVYTLIEKSKEKIIEQAFFPEQRKESNLFHKWMSAICLHALIFIIVIGWLLMTTPSVDIIRTGYFPGMLTLSAVFCLFYLYIIGQAITRRLFR